MIRIESFNKHTLKDYLASDAFKSSPVIPISTHRSLSHISNPRATDEDVLLLVAYENETLVGYLGVLPDDVFNTDGQKMHCGWMSCLWIDPHHRGKKIAQQLITACFAAWDNRILLTEYTASAGNLYEKMGIFTHLRDSNGTRWYIRSDLKTILPPKKDIFRHLLPVLKIFDTIANIFMGMISYFRKKKVTRHYLVYAKTLIPDAATLVEAYPKKGPFCRSGREVDWILHFPWILSGKDIAMEQKRYHFTAFEKVFECRMVNAYNDKDTCIATVLYTDRNGHLRIPYFFHANDISVVADIVMDIVHNRKIKTCSIYDKELIAAIKNCKSLAVPHKTIQRSYLISKKWMEECNIDTAIIRDGDGDCAFT